MNRTIRFLSSLSVLLLSSAFICYPANAANFHGKIPYTTEKTFQKDVLQSGQPVLVDFCATWCAPCRAMAPLVEDLAHKYSGKVRFYKVDIDDDEDLADDLKVDAVPTFMLFDHGCIIKTATGYVGSERLDADISDGLKESTPTKTVQTPNQTY